MVVFGPIILFFGFFLFLILLFFTFIGRLILKSKNEDWQGEVIDKKHNEVRDNEYKNKMNHYYYLLVKTENGSERKIGLSSVMWDKFSIGDKLHKPKGKLFPEKIA